MVYPIAFFDPPMVLNASVTPIPGSGSSPLQVVADIGFRAAYNINYIDSTGDFIGVYLGASGDEKLLCVVGGGTSSIIPAVVAAKSRVSLRSMTASSITNGYLFVTFLGQGIK